ncbi:hypothetical protein CWB85_18690 [Pseudoalteromonas sp. S1727]|uniref:hypothetical protein n=1 Tax=Pseudoalteromonas sp. S1727 TaxID=2066514 RepID=UPI001109A14E|nr:hypothetical protein [Pseudoalteromonas sp. S1727]TMN68081.1 hypothetical protein CWB85_18690 [Pseudoalteromonas sp. S1727]
MTKLTTLTSLTHFITARKNKSLVPLSDTAVAIEKEVIVSNFTKSNESKEFSERVVSLVNSPEVINEVSDRLGVPKDGESQQEFVARGKNALRDTLLKKLSVK